MTEPATCLNCNAQLTFLGWWWFDPYGWASCVASPGGGPHQTDAPIPADEGTAYRGEDTTG